MEFKIEVKCEYCNLPLAYRVSGDIRKGATFIVEPCEHCTNNAMDEAWKIIKERGVDKEPTDESTQV